MSVIEGLDPGYLNAGLMKPRRGLTPTTGKKKLGVGQRDERKIWAGSRLETDPFPRKKESKKVTEFERQVRHRAGLRSH